MFTSWLMEQRGTEGSVGRFADVAFSDINAGCASMYKYATDWKRHFDARHSRQLPELMSMLGDAYVAYCLELDKNKEPF